MAPGRDRLEERLDEEELLLAEAFPAAQLDRDSLTVLLPDYELPRGWSHDRTDVLIVIPENYPAGAPDNVGTRPELHLTDGREAANTMGIHEHVGRRWLQFSWHIDSEWRPRASAAEGSNLVTFVLGALARFDEAS